MQKISVSPTEGLTLTNIRAVVDIAIFPFVSTGIRAHTQESWIDGEVTISIEVRNMPSFPFETSFFHRDIVAAPEGAAMALLKEIFTYYHKRRALRVDDHIYLGED